MCAAAAALSRVQCSFHVCSTASKQNVQRLSVLTFVAFLSLTMTDLIWPFSSKKTSRSPFFVRSLFANVLMFSVFPFSISTYKQNSHLICHHSIIFTRYSLCPKNDYLGVTHKMGKPQLWQTALTTMWADAQRDGRPAEYRWRPLQQNAAKFGRRPLLECCAVTLPIQQNARLGRKVNFALGKLPSGGKRPQKMYI